MDADLGVKSDMCHEYGSRRDRDDILFAQPESSNYGDCPICFLPLPIDTGKHVVLTCCSKFICSGCRCADMKHHMNRSLERRCPFCRELPPATSAKIVANLMRRVEANDPVAMQQVGGIHHSKGEYNKAFHYWRKASGLGNAKAHFDLSFLYHDGEGVEKDEQKFIHHSEEAAIAGHPIARFNLGFIEWNDGNFERAVKHLIIAANLGEEESLKMLKQGYAKGLVSKEDFAAALRAYQTAVDATKSTQREVSGDIEHVNIKEMNDELQKATATVFA